MVFAFDTQDKFDRWYTALLKLYECCQSHFSYLHTKTGKEATEISLNRFQESRGVWQALKNQVRHSITAMSAPQDEMPASSRGNENDNNDSFASQDEYFEPDVEKKKNTMPKEWKQAAGPSSPQATTVPPSSVAKDSAITSPPPPSSNMPLEVDDPNVPPEWRRASTMLVTDYDA